MPMVRRILSVAFERKTYLSVGYVLLRLPLALVYFGIGGLIISRLTDSVFNIFLILPAGVAIWGAVVTERAMAKSWFGAELTPMAPERPPDRTWAQRISDVLTNPVTWKCVAFAIIEVPVGFFVGALLWLGLLVGTVGTFGSLLGALIAMLVAVFGARSADVPPVVVPTFLAAAVFGSGVLLATLYAARAVARAQVWFVRVMLGMSATQLALAAARAEAATERARAEIADRSRRDLVLNVSHELRNPLATIRAHVDTLRGEDGGEPPEQDRQRYLEVLSRETDRLAALVDELLTLASADTGQLQLEVGPVNAAEVATQVHDAMAPLAWRERRIQLLYNKDDAPAVKADRRRLAQVLMNLVRNAITQTPEGGLVAIELKTEPNGPVQLTVSDTGPGIAPEETDKIFERFYRTDTSRSRTTGGFGLGLAIAREMVDAMGGRITVDSTPGQGSRFTVTLARA